MRVYVCVCGGGGGGAELRQEKGSELIYLNSGQQAENMPGEFKTRTITQSSDYRAELHAIQ